MAEARKNNWTMAVAIVAVPIEGGIPLVMDGKIVGAIGLSGGSSDQDGQCAKAGVAELK